MCLVLNPLIIIIGLVNKWVDKEAMSHSIFDYIMNSS